MSKWTPGNWIAATRPSSIVGWPIFSSPTGRTIANVHGQDEQSKANARLIAAAPDLYKALEDVLRIADRATVEFDAARAALAKARGEQ